VLNGEERDDHKLDQMPLGWKDDKLDDTLSVHNENLAGFETRNVGDLHTLDDNRRSSVVSDAMTMMADTIVS